MALRVHGLSRLAIQLFNCLRSSPPSEYYFLKRKPNFGGCPEEYSELCQTSQMERVVKIVNSFLPLRNASSDMFDRVLNTPLGLRRAVWNLLE